MSFFMTSLVTLVFLGVTKATCPLELRVETDPGTNIANQYANTGALVFCSTVECILMDGGFNLGEIRTINMFGSSSFTRFSICECGGNAWRGRVLSLSLNGQLYTASSPSYQWISADGAADGGLKCRNYRLSGNNILYNGGSSSNSLLQCNEQTDYCIPSDGTFVTSTSIYSNTGSDLQFCTSNECSVLNGPFNTGSTRVVDFTLSNTFTSFSICSCSGDAWRGTLNQINIGNINYVDISPNLVVVSDDGPADGGAVCQNYQISGLTFNRVGSSSSNSQLSC